MAPELTSLLEVLTRRYPRHEWGTFLRFGWRETPSGLVLTLAALDPPGDGDLDNSVGNVAFQETYSLRAALSVDNHLLAMGVAHSHPKGYPPLPSYIDDDMDNYYAGYFGSFAPSRPYVSLVFSEVDTIPVLSGRVYWRDKWLKIDRLRTPLFPTLRLWQTPRRTRRKPLQSDKRRARLASAFGEEATARLREATVAVFGAGGTGSAAIEVLARAGVGSLIIVDPDEFDESNLERLHGSAHSDIAARRSKVLIAKEHVRSIAPDTKVQAYIGSLPHPDILDIAIHADIAIGCTDQQHSRLALSDLSVRYLVPAIDTGVVMEGNAGRVSAQVLQLVRFLPDDPCAICRGMILPRTLSQELMTDQEKRARQQAQLAAPDEDANQYWVETPQLNTVGFLTTTAGSLAAGYCIGWLTGRYEPPFSRLQANLMAPNLEAVEPDDHPLTACACRRSRAHADQGAADALISAPSHWPKPIAV